MGLATSFVFYSRSRAQVTLMIGISCGLVFSSEDFYIVFVIAHWCNVHDSTSSSFSCDNHEWLVLRVIPNYGVRIKSDASFLSSVVVVSDAQIFRTSKMKGYTFVSVIFGLYICSCNGTSRTRDERGCENGILHKQLCLALKTSLIIYNYKV